MSVCAAAGSNQVAAQKHKLAQVKARIAAVTDALNDAVTQRGHLTAQLRDIERDLGKAQAALRDTTRDIHSANKKLAGLKRKQASEQKALDAEKKALAAQIRAAYIAGNEDRLKLILNQQDPATLQRMLAYYGYFNRARASRVKAFTARLKRLAQLKHDIHAELARLDDLKQQRQSSLDKIKRQQADRRAVLAKVNASIGDKNSKLARLKHSEQQLKHLIEQLSNVLGDIPKSLDTRSFASQRGKLSWPVAGSHLAHYGSLRADGRLHWKGVLIGGKAGTPVHAIAHGRVIYAGWLPHFGLLIIVNHGDGYMSLYAHNQSLYEKVGDWVRAGETIATLGDTGGRSKPALYFEIRHDKKPVNPRRWCH